MLLGQLRPHHIGLDNHRPLTFKAVCVVFPLMTLGRHVTAKTRANEQMMLIIS